MNTGVVVAVCGAASYLLGAVPTAYIVARAKGVDIRTVGSGNVGATNVFRAVGKGWGIFTLAVDMLKGFVPAFGFPLAAAAAGYDAQGRELGLVCALLAIAGHNWPVYLGFKGGKGVATSAGALLGLTPAAFAAGLATFAVVFAITRYVSLGSILAAVVACAASWALYARQGLLVPIAYTVLAVILVWRHRSNIVRLMKGEERKT